MKVNFSQMGLWSSSSSLVWVPDWAWKAMCLCLLLSEFLNSLQAHYAFGHGWFTYIFPIVCGSVVVITLILSFFGHNCSAPLKFCWRQKCSSQQRHSGRIMSIPHILVYKPISLKFTFTQNEAPIPQMLRAMIFLKLGINRWGILE